MKKSIILLAMVLCVSIMVAGCSSFSEGVEAGMEDAMNTETVSEEITLESEMEETVTVTEPVIESETEVSDPVVESEVPETTVAEQTNEADELNILMEAELVVSDVMNGVKTEKIGEWAEITIDKETLKSVPMEDFVEFCNEVVDGSGYNWVTISCGDGTGIQFQGSISYVATYGTLDNDGCIVDMIGTIMLQSDNTYSYSELE